MPAKNIIFITMVNATFVNKDIQILEGIGEVTVYRYKKSKGFPFAWELLRSFFIFLKLFRKSTHVYIWFADYHAFMPVMMAKWFRLKSYVNIGGYDAAHIPEIKYGAYTNPLRAFCSKYAVRNATYVLPVAERLGERLKDIVGHIKGEVITVPFGFKADNWYCNTEKEDVIVTVAIFGGEQRIKIKGLDFYCEVARSMPEYQFVIIGADEEGKQLLDAPENVLLVPKVQQEELRSWYSKSKVYAQFSISEGLPNAVIESMFCECIPIGTDVGGIVNIIGDKGFVLEPRDVKLAQNQIKQAFNDKNLGKEARDRALTKYPFDKRERLLVDLI